MDTLVLILGKIWDARWWLNQPFPKNPSDPSRSNRMFRVPIPSETNRSVGIISFLGHTWILRDLKKSIRQIGFIFPRDRAEHLKHV